jgi:hypothetical protein
MSRGEIEARLKASEASVKLEHLSIHSKVDLVLEKMSHMQSLIPDLHNHVSKLRDEVKADYSFTRWTIAGIVIAAVGALWVTQANLMAALALIK